jgi:hypothetical protein
VAISTTEAGLLQLLQFAWSHKETSVSSPDIREMYSLHPHQRLRQRAAKVHPQIVHTQTPPFVVAQVRVREGVGAANLKTVVRLRTTAAAPDCPPRRRLGVVINTLGPAFPPTLFCCPPISFLWPLWPLTKSRLYQTVGRGLVRLDVWHTTHGRDASRGPPASSSPSTTPRAMTR